MYNEIMNVPLYVRVPGVTSAGSVTDALSSHVDLATTICALAGAQPDPGMRGVDQSPNVVQDVGRDRAEHRRMERAGQVGDARVGAIGGQRVLHEIVGADREEVAVLGQALGHHRRRGHACGCVRHQDRVEGG